MDQHKPLMQNNRTKERTREQIRTLGGRGGGSRRAHLNLHPNLQSTCFKVFLSFRTKRVRSKGLFPQRVEVNLHSEYNQDYDVQQHPEYCGNGVTHRDGALVPAPSLFCVLLPVFRRAHSTALKRTEKLMGNNEAVSELRVDVNSVIRTCPPLDLEREPGAS